MASVAHSIHFEPPTAGRKITKGIWRFLCHKSRRIPLPWVKDSKKLIPLMKIAWTRLFCNFLGVRNLSDGPTI